LQTEDTTLRLFVAIRLPDEVKKTLERLQLELRQGVPKAAIRWTPSDQLHLTLKFLGNVEAHKVEPLAEALRIVCRDVAAIELHAQTLGYFPGQNRPRVIWVGIGDERGELERLQNALCAASRPFTGGELDEVFRGHATLGRIKRISRPEIKILSRLGDGRTHTLFGKWTADAIELMRSELSSQGPRHTCVASISLRR